MMKNILNKTVLVTLSLFYTAVLPIILSNYNYGRAYSDQKNYHYPTILHFSKSIDITDYPVTMTPGYHLFMAVINKWISSSELILKLVNSLFTALIFILIAAILEKNFKITRVISICLPALSSIYFYPAAAWLSPDNLSWLLVFIVLNLTMKSPLTFRIQLTIAACLFLSVLVRQTNIWLFLPVLLAGRYNSVYENQEDSSGILHNLTPYVKLLPIILPGLITLLVFIYIWGGLVTPRYQTALQNFNLAAPCFFFAIFFTVSVFYLPFFLPQLKVLIKSRNTKYILACAFLFGIIVSIIPHTDYNEQEGRLSGLWNLVKTTPVYESRSILLIILSALGTTTLTSYLLLVHKKRRRVLVASLSAFVIVQTLNHNAYERYYFSFIFIFLVLCLNQLSRENKIKGNLWQIFMPSTLAGINLAVLIYGLT